MQSQSKNSISTLNAELTTNARKALPKPKVVKMREAALRLTGKKQIVLTVAYKKGAQVKPKRVAPVNIQTSDDAHRFLMKIWDKSTINSQESFYAIFLNRNSEVIDQRLMHLGTSNTCEIDIALLMSAALTRNSAKILIAHNHPSGDIEPSNDDIQSTREIQQAAGILRLQLIDHLIVSQYQYYSFNGHGKIN